MRNGRILFVVLAALVLLGLVAGTSWYAYNVGAAQGVMEGSRMVALPVERGVSAVLPSGLPYRYYQPFGWRPFGFGFGFLGCLAPIFLFLFVFALFRFAFRPHWGGGWRGRGWHMPEGDIPPHVKEWHRKLHEQETNTAPPPQGQPG